MEPAGQYGTWGHVLVSKLSGFPYYKSQGNFIENICC